MNIEELVTQAKTAANGTLDDIPDAKARALVRAVFAQLARDIKDATDSVKVMGLGVFQVKQVEREKDGEKKTVRKIRFRAAAPKAPGEGKPGERKPGAGKARRAARKAAAQAADGQSAA